MVLKSKTYDPCNKIKKLNLLKENYILNLMKMIIKISMNILKMIKIMMMF